MFYFVCVTGFLDIYSDNKGDVSKQAVGILMV